jgi:hypothetical protein
LPGYYYFTWSVKKSDNVMGATVSMGTNVTARNGDFLEDDWYSPFGEQSEAFVSQFQPIARSSIEGRASNNTYTQNNKGVIFDCDENQLMNQPSILQGTESLKGLPKEFLTCKNVTERVYIGIKFALIIND